MKLKFVLFFSVVCLTQAHSRYKQNIPNGDKIPDPCNSGNLWNGVGHYRSAGGGNRNPFGQDFAQQQHKWSKELCNKDSDGDGKSNGQELGDPDCEWTEGATPKLTTGLSHPGVCEPVDSDSCKTKNSAFGAEFCKPKAECEAVKTSNSYNLTYIRTEIPSAVTNYYCQAYEFKESMYVYATQMQVDNTEVMHHALLFGCKSKPNEMYFKSPTKCYMSSADCNDIISLWSIGVDSDCFYKDLHIALGPGNSYEYALLQYHWNNPEQKKGMFDSSTMKLFYGTTPRQYNAGIFMSGQLSLKLPPGQPKITRVSKSGPDCSRYVALRDTVYITMSVIHMHGLGRGGYISQWRNGQFLRYLVPPKPYDYNEPEIFRPPNSTYEFLKGDELRMQCEFSTRDRTYSTYLGEGTDDEMCYGFFRVFPKENLISTFFGFISVGSIDICEAILPQHGGINLSPNKLENCDVKKFLEEVYQPQKLLFDEFCKTSHTFCRHDCKEIAKKFLDHPCWQGDPYVFMKQLRFYVYGRSEMVDIDNRLVQCRMEIERDMAKVDALNEYKKKVDLLISGSMERNQIMSPIIFSLFITAAAVLK